VFKNCMLSGFGAIFQQLQYFCTNWSWPKED
jgi:hypothetical protein